MLPSLPFLNPLLALHFLLFLLSLELLLSHPHRACIVQTLTAIYAAVLRNGSDRSMYGEDCVGNSQTLINLIKNRWSCLRLTSLLFVGFASPSYENIRVDEASARLERGLGQ